MQSEQYLLRGASSALQSVSRLICACSGLPAHPVLPAHLLLRQLAVVLLEAEHVLAQTPAKFVVPKEVDRSRAVLPQGHKLTADLVRGHHLQRETVKANASELPWVAPCPILPWTLKLIPLPGLATMDNR